MNIQLFLLPPSFFLMKNRLFFLFFRLCQNMLRSRIFEQFAILGIRSRLIIIIRFTNQTQIFFLLIDLFLKTNFVFYLFSKIVDVILMQLKFCGNLVLWKSVPFWIHLLQSWKNFFEHINGLAEIFSSFEVGNRI